MTRISQSFIAIGITALLIAFTFWFINLDWDLVIQEVRWFFGSSSVEPMLLSIALTCCSTGLVLRMIAKVK